MYVIFLARISTIYMSTRLSMTSTSTTTNHPIHPPNPPCPPCRLRQVEQSTRTNTGSCTRKLRRKNYGKAETICKFNQYRFCRKQHYDIHIICCRRFKFVEKYLHNHSINKTVGANISYLQNEMKQM